MKIRRTQHAKAHAMVLGCLRGSFVPHFFDAETSKSNLILCIKPWSNAKLILSAEKNDQKMGKLRSQKNWLAKIGASCFAELVLRSPFPSLKKNILFCVCLMFLILWQICWPCFVQKCWKGQGRCMPLSKCKISYQSCEDVGYSWKDVGYVSYPRFSSKCSWR